MIFRMESGAAFEQLHRSFFDTKPAARMAPWTLAVAKAKAKVIKAAFALSAFPAPSSHSDHGHDSVLLAVRL
jgi:hypothetical protein